MTNHEDHIKMFEDKKSLILTKAKMSKLVQQRVARDRCTHLDAIISICEDHSLEPDQISHLINQQLKEKIRCEAIEERMIKDSFTSTSVF